MTVHGYVTELGLAKFKPFYLQIKQWDEFTPLVPQSWGA